MYGDETILKNVSFAVTTGERVGLVGPNGAGKTTALKVMAGEIEPSSGTGGVWCMVYGLWCMVYMLYGVWGMGYGV